MPLNLPDKGCFNGFLYHKPNYTPSELIHHTVVRCILVVSFISRLNIQKNQNVENKCFDICFYLLTEKYNLTRPYFKFHMTCYDWNKSFNSWATMDIYCFSTCGFLVSTESLTQSCYFTTLPLSCPRLLYLVDPTPPPPKLWISQ